MKTDEFLVNVYPCIGSEANVSKTIVNGDCIYVFVKDAGMVNLPEVQKVAGIERCELERSRLTLVLNKETKEKIMDNLKLAKEIIEKIGGAANISGVSHCMTRLRFDVKDNSLVDEEALKNVEGVLGLFKAGGQFQVVVGQTVPKIYDEICKLGNFEKVAAINENLDGEKKTVKSVLGGILNYLSASMASIIPAFMAAAMFKTLAVVLGPTMLNVIEETSDLYVLFTFIHDACFYYMPIFVGYTACKKLGINPVLGIYLGAILLSPTFIGMVGNVEKFTVFGIEAPLADYSSSIVPMLIAVYVMSLFEKLFRKFIPTVISTVFVPFLTILVMTPLLFCLIAPLGNRIANVLSGGLIGLAQTGGFIAVPIIAALWEYLVLTGMHQPVVIFAIMSIFSTGNPDACVLVAGCCATFAVYGTAVGALIKAKKKEDKSLALGYVASGLIGGIAEPTLYGICMKYKKPFIAMTIAAFAGGLYAGITKVVFMLASTNILTILGYVPYGTTNTVNGIISVTISFVLAAVLTVVIGLDEKEA